MKAERWQHVKQVFQFALECGEAEREAYLQRACGKDDALRAEVESLLASHSEAESFLEVPVSPEGNVQNTIGETIGHYNVVRKIGAGGMGEVFLAEDHVLRRPVALKFLSAQIQENPAFRGRLLMEAKAAAAVDHPYVCKIYQMEEIGGNTFLVLEYVEGETLKAAIESRKFINEDLLRIISEMAEALAEAHLKNVVHGDIKPSNLMLTSRGHVKVMDFGIAKRTPRNGEVTTTYGVIPPGVTVGTPVYMAPEQLLGHAADSKSDIFASGIVVYELVSGVHPFRRSTVEATIAAILHENHQPLASVVQDLPDGLSTVVDRMLEKSREARYASMEAVWLDLRQIDHQRKTAQQHRSPGAESAVEIAIAVLPFRDLSSGKDQEYFCDGLVEELISALTQVDGIRVAPRTSVFRFKEASLDLREIAAQLNVPIVLEGSVRKSGQQLRVIVNLVDAVANHSLWSEKYEAKLSGVFKIQDAIVRTVTEKLQATLLPAKAPRLTAGALPAVRFDAYEEYLHGRFCWNKRTESGLHQSVRHFDNAIAAQPDYVAALAGLADSYCALGLYGALSPENAMPKARNTAHRVLALDTSSSIARTTLACVAAIFDWDWAEAEKQFKLGIDSDPKYALAHHWYANNLLIPLERFDEARFEAQAAQALEPESPAIALTSGLVSYFEQRYLQAIEEFLHAAEIDPGFGMTYYFLGQAYLQAERPALALEVLQTANTLTGGSPEVLSMLGYAHAVSGNTTEASALLEELIRRAASRYISPVLVAQLLIGLDQLEDAVAYISQAQRVHAADLIWLRIRPQFSKLRTDVRFISVCEKLAI